MKRRKMLRQYVAGVVRTVSALGAGFLAGVLAVFVALHSLGAFRVNARPITIRPVIDIRTPTSTPPPTSTPQPTSTPTAEEKKEERDDWRGIMLPTPYMEAQRVSYPQTSITTGRKKAKRKTHKIKDENEDGILEARVPMVDIDGILIGFMRHRCCACASTHRVSFRLEFNGYGLPILVQRWAVDDEATHENRREQFGPGYWKPTTPGPGIGERRSGDLWEERR